MSASVVNRTHPSHGVTTRPHNLPFKGRFSEVINHAWNPFKKVRHSLNNLHVHFDENAEDELVHLSTCTRVHFDLIIQFFF